VNDLAEELGKRLGDLAGRFDVPGAQAAVLTPDGVVDAAYGVLNLDTGVAATTDSVFQIGSITKVWTATLVMELVDEGEVDLDAPIVTYLPEFTVADPALARAVTIRHLLSHSSGIDGDLFLDTGRGDDNLEKYVAAMAGLAQTHPLGVTMSYCNSGYSLLGRLVEVRRGKTWDAVLREQIFAPLGLTRAGTLPEEALLHRAAVGHTKEPGSDGLHVVPAWGIYRSAGPAGLIHATSAEVVAFAKLHLDSGLAPDGTRVISAESAAAMRVPQVEIPDPYTLGTHWGLGWILNSWQRPDGSTTEVFGHDGATLGQQSFLRVFPEAGVAVALSANGGHSRELFEALEADLVAGLVGAAPRPRLTPRDEPVPEAVRRARTGTYERESVRITVVERDGGLVATYETLGPLAAGRPPEQLELLPAADGFFVTRLEPEAAWTPVVFFDLPDGSSYLHFGARSTPRNQPTPQVRAAVSSRPLGRSTPGTGGTS